MASSFEDIIRDLVNIQADVGLILLGLQDQKTQQIDTFDRFVFCVIFMFEYTQYSQPIRL